MTTTNVHGLIQFALSQVWAMRPEEHRRMMEILARHADGVRLSEDELVAATGRTKPERGVAMDVDEKTGVATIPIHGVIAHRASAVGRVSSRVGTSVEHIRDDLQAALGNDKVTSILLDIDSPGGSVSGIDELAAEIREARSRKPIVAHTDSLMASAAYYLGSQAHKVFATKSAEVGSIGVIAGFYDDHRRAANAGFDPVIVKSTPAKGSVQSNGSFSDADRADLQRSVDHFHALFVEAVAAGRGVDDATAQAMGDGRVYIGAEAKRLGFIDGIATRAGALKDLRSLARSRAAAAEIDQETVGDVADGSSPDAGSEMTKTIDEKAAATAGASQTTATPNAADQEKAIAEARSHATTCERLRCGAILRGAAAAQRELALKLIDDGATAVEALTQLNADLTAQLATARALPTDNTKSLAKGNSAKVAPAETDEDSRIAAMDEGDDKWKAEFAASKELREEFGTFELYRGWKRNEATLAARGDGAD